MRRGMLLVGVDEVALVWCRVATILLDERCHCCHDDIEAVQRAVQRLVCRQRVLLLVVSGRQTRWRLTCV